MSTPPKEVEEKAVETGLSAENILTLTSADDASIDSTAEENEGRHRKEESLLPDEESHTGRTPVTVGTTTPSAAIDRNRKEVIEALLFPEAGIELPTSTPDEERTDQFEQKVLAALEDASATTTVAARPLAPSLLRHPAAPAVDTLDPGAYAVGGPRTHHTSTAEQPIRPGSSSNGNNNNNSGLVRARAVEDNHHPLQDAQPVEEDGPAAEGKPWIKQACFILVLVTGIAAIALGVGLGTKKDSSKNNNTFAPTPVPTLAPTKAPSPAPTGALEAMKAYLPSHTLDSLGRFDTPQWKAWDWLSVHPNITKFPEWRKQQLFALATFFYAMEGESWYPPIHDSWMDYNNSECLWYSNTLGFFGGGPDNPHYVVHPDQRKASPCNQLGKFTSLELWDLALEDKPGPQIPPEISLLTSLRIIDLSKNDLTVPVETLLPTELGLLTSLIHLELAFNEFNGTIPSRLGQFTRLDHLRFTFNSFTGSVPSQLGLLTSLTNLALDNNGLNGTLPSQIGRWTAMQGLTLHDNEFTGPFPTELGVMTALAYLYLLDNNLEGSIPTQWGSMAALERIDMFGNNITGTIPSEYGRLTNLETLGFYYMEGRIPSEIGRLTNLVGLEMNDNSFSGPIPSELGLLTQLKYLLSLTDNSLTGPIPTQLGRITALNSLLLQGNRLTGQIPSECFQMVALTAFNVGMNELTGNIPTEIALLTALQFAKFNDNELTGPLPSEMGLLTSVRIFDASTNALTGPVPPELATMNFTTLRTRGGKLLLHNNSLNGEIPQALCNNTQLFDISVDCTPDPCSVACSCLQCECL